jgi:hypothetical protein
VSYPTPEGHYCSWLNPDGVEECWEVEALWDAVKGLTPETVDLATLDEVTDTSLWLCHWRDPTHPMTVPELARIDTADMSYPVILHPRGWLMDGMHRVAKALMSGSATVQAVRLTPETLPPPWFY